MRGVRAMPHDTQGVTTMDQAIPFPNPDLCYQFTERTQSYRSSDNTHPAFPELVMANVRDFFATDTQLPLGT